VALNYGIECHIYEEDGDTKIADAKVRAYFYKVNSSSSDSVWNGEIEITNGVGQTSFNLGDDSFLGSDGKIDNGDVVLICAWLADNKDSSVDDKSSQESGKISRCVNFIHTVNTDSSSYTEAFVMPNVVPPSCDITFPDDNNTSHTGHNFTIKNNSTVPVGPWTYTAEDEERDDLYQNFTKYSQDLFLGRYIKETNYNLVETNQTLDVIDDLTYKWVDAGTYNTVVRVYDYLGIYCEETFTYEPRYNKPTIDFDFTFTKLLNTDKHIGVGNDDEMDTTQQSHTNYGDTWSQINASFDWFIEDYLVDGTDNSDTYTDKDETYEPTKLYNSEGTREIKLTINWNDGFDDQQEVLSKDAILDVYNISLSFNWTDEKNNTVNDVSVPLGDDDLVTLHNNSSDNASQDYDSTTQWKTVDWSITKKKNDGSDDNESFSYSKDNDDSFNEEPTFFIKYWHHDDDKALASLSIGYWDGYQDVSKTLNSNIETDKYHINHDFVWDTKFYGRNKIVTRDDDEITLTNLTTFTPQNNTDNVTDCDYEITKLKYKSYDDTDTEDDSETFEYDGLTDNPTFFLRIDDKATVKNTISFYNGYESETSELSKDITAVKCTLNQYFKCTCRNGTNVPIEGRDDLATFTNISDIENYYGDKQYTSSPRFNSDHWTLLIDYNDYNFKEIDKIGGELWGETNTIVSEFDKDCDETISVNYFSKQDAQSVKMKTNFNNGFYNEIIELEKSVSTTPYETIEINAI